MNVGMLRYELTTRKSYLEEKLNSLKLGEVSSLVASVLMLMLAGKAGSVLYGQPQSTGTVFLIFLFTLIAAIGSNSSRHWYRQERRWHVAQLALTCEHLDVLRHRTHLS